ncbi:MAG: hypothetical protein R3350_11010 [Saprospiraceae bacterium]|nr:hypothetical protein [Saprospiraceae bacterium]
MTNRTRKRKLLRAKIILNQTLQKILDINHKRKKLKYTSDPQTKNQSLSEELKVLNKVAAQQAKLIERYRSILGQKV